MRRVLALITLVVVLVAVPSPPAFAGEPTVAVGSDRVAVDDVIQVRGSRWPAGDLVTIEFCGNDALDATVDCDIRNTTSFAVRDSTEFFGAVTVTYPPKPCPCVVRVTSQTAPQAITVPIDFPSAGFVPAEEAVPDADISRSIGITALDVQETSGWSAWFGAPASRVAEVTVTNDGNVAISDTTLTLTIGKGNDPTDIVSSRELGVIEAGETIQMSVPFELNALSAGSYTVKATISGLGEDIDARASTSTIPWGLLVIALIVLQLVLLLIRNRVRGRVEDGVAADEADLDEIQVGAAVGAAATAAAADGTGEAASDPEGPPEGDDAVDPSGATRAIGAPAAIATGAVGGLAAGAAAVRSDDTSEPAVDPPDEPSPADEKLGVRGRLGRWFASLEAEANGAPPMAPAADDAEARAADIEEGTHESKPTADEAEPRGPVHTNSVENG